MATKRPYTGNSDGIGRRRAGTQEMQRLLNHHSGGRLWNLGTFTVRPMRGKPPLPRFLSVHATGRAADVSRRKVPGKHAGVSRAYMLEVIAWFIANADALELEMLADYEWRGKDERGRPLLGRVWKCDRAAWKGQTPGSIAHGGSGDWIHYELSPAVADSVERVRAANWATFPTGKTASGSNGPDYPGRAVRLGDTGPNVELIQRRLGIPVTGKFDTVTDTAVRGFQRANPMTGPVDGLVGPRTWAAMFG